MAVEPIPLADGGARRRAATDFETNLVVEAGAGTGKTSLLVERVLNAIGTGRVTIDRLAAITFTEKAAGEMRERIAGSLDRLRRLALGEIEPETIREADRAWTWLAGDARVSADVVALRGLEAMEQLDTGTVTTIHGFCSELLRSYPVESGVDPEFVVDAGERAEMLKRDQWVDFVSRELGRGAGDARRLGRWRELLRRVELPDIAALGGAICTLAPPPDDESGRHPASDLLRPLVEGGIGALDDLLARQTGSTENVASWFHDCRAALMAFADRGAGALRDRLDAGRPNLEKTINPGKRLRGVEPAEFKHVVGSIKSLLRELSTIDETITNSAANLLTPLAADFRESSLRAGFVGFDGLLVLARDLLRDHAEVRDRLKRRFDMLFVDEFQDTDPLQYEIVLALSEGERPGKLFVVGDPKQSIYRFRGADYAAYREATERIVSAGGATLHLTSNFRSTTAIVRAVNALFHDSWWRPSEYQPAYVPISEVADDAGPGPAVEVWSVLPPPGARADVRRDLEGRLIADEIVRMAREGSCRYREVTILFRSFSSITNYLRPLRERGVPFVVDGGREFLRRPEVLQLLATLSAVAQPNDPASLVAFLRGPAGGAPDTELADWAADGGRWHAGVTPDPSRFPRLSDALLKLREIIEATRDLPADAVVREVLRRTEMLTLGAAAFEGPQRVANLRKLAATAADLARDGTLALDEVVDALGEGRVQDIETDRPLADDAAEAVRITSIHRMKGLEADVVFVADLARGGHPGSADATAVRRTRLIDGRTVTGVRLAGWSNAAWVRGRIEDQQHGEAEERRVFYVAATRARRRMIVVAADAGRRSSDWIEALRGWGLDPGDRPADGKELASGDVVHRVPVAAAASRDPEPDDEGAIGAAVAAYGRAHRAARLLSQPSVEQPSRHDAELDAEGRRSGIGRPLARSLGIVMHRLLERWPSAAEDPQADLEALCLEQAEVPDAGRLRREAEELLTRFLESGLGERLRTLDVVGRELPMIHRYAEDRIRHGNIDLLYRREDGRLVVADFKTDSSADPALLEERYGTQLRAYAEAVSAAFGGPAPHQELWLLRHGRVLPLSAQRPGAGDGRVSADDEA